MDLDVVFLGTSGSVPTARRNVSATLVRRGGDRLLVDCGEGTQRQLLKSDVGLVDLEDVFLTHLHADHVLGLPGMLKTFALRGREVPVRLHGPRGTRALLDELRRVFGRLTYEVHVTELEPGDAVERDDYRMEAVAVHHGTARAIGYVLREDPRPGRFDLERADALGVPAGPARGALQRGEAVEVPGGGTVTPADVLGPERPGRVVALSGDTEPCATLIAAAHGADVLVHEATFLADEEERARENGHSTAAQAAEVARTAGVRLLALTHLSARYGGKEVAEEARAIFPDTVVPRDFDTVTVPFAERGAPALVSRGARTGSPAGVPSDV